MPRLTVPETRDTRASHTRDAADCLRCGGWGAILLTGGGNLGRPAWGPCPDCRHEGLRLVQPEETANVGA